MNRSTNFPGRSEIAGTMMRPGIRALDRPRSARQQRGVLFNSQAFVLGFLPPVLALFYLAPGRMTRQVVLVAASLLFYAGWDPRFVPALAGLTFANWAIARWFGRSRRNAVLGLGLALNLLVLGVCKYANFLGASVAALLQVPFTPWPIILPLGVSFFAFQKISYLIDLRRGDRHQYGLLEFFAFVTFFPQLIAGPIVRHNEMIPQFARDPRGPQAWENLSRGAVLFAIGFAKKVGLADTAALTCDPVFAAAAAGAVGGAPRPAGTICTRSSSAVAHWNGSPIAAFTTTPGTGASLPPARS